MMAGRSTTTTSLPVVLLGGAGGRIQGGRVLDYNGQARPPDVPAVPVDDGQDGRAPGKLRRRLPDCSRKSESARPLMHSLFHGALILLLGGVCATLASDSKPAVLIVTGGHPFERAAFAEVFAGDTEFEFTTAEHDKGAAGVWDRADLASFAGVVLYDMPQQITDSQRANFLALFDRGAGLVVLHHALVSFQGWPDYERIIGGRYPKPPDGAPQVTDRVGYRHDVDFIVTVLDLGHPITAGLADFPIHDEIYWGFRVGADVHPLLSTSDAKAGKPLMWTREEKKSRIVYLQLGHGPSAYENPNYRRLVAQAIHWAVRKTE